VFTSGFGGAFKQIQIEVQGPEIDRLNQLALQVRDILGQVPGAVDVGLSTRGQKPEVEVQLDRALAGRLGVTMADLATALRPAFAGLHAGDWIDPSGETRKVMVRLDPQARERPADLARLPLSLGPGPDGGAPTTIPLGQVARLRSTVGPAEIDHLDREKTINVQANVQGRSLTEVVRDLNARLARVPLPPGYSIHQGGEARDQAEVFGRVGLALVVALVLMYLILVIQFGSFLDPWPSSSRCRSRSSAWCWRCC
jgi:HAE1 family hydrophobic/amphiphilic exporter-1